MQPIYDPFGPSTNLAKLLYTALHRLGLCWLFGYVHALRRQSHIPVSLNTKLVTTNSLNPPPSPKLIPWFVSDVTPPDFVATFEALKVASSFFEINGASAVPSVDHLNKMVTRWKKYLDEGLFSLSVPLDTSLGDVCTAQGQDAAFWTSMYPYWDMETHAPGLYSNLKNSDLVIFKVSLYAPLLFARSWIWRLIAGRSKVRMSLGFSSHPDNILTCFISSYRKYVKMCPLLICGVSWFASRAGSRVISDGQHGQNLRMLLVRLPHYSLRYIVNILFQAQLGARFRFWACEPTKRMSLLVLIAKLQSSLTNRRRNGVSAGGKIFVPQVRCLGW